MPMIEMAEQKTSTVDVLNLNLTSNRKYSGLQGT